MGKFVLHALLTVLLVVGVQCEEIKDVETENVVTGRELIEQGRTFVHHAMKRLAFIMPAIFFKLGVAFTLLILVTIVAVNNGVIGFMLLVVGLSTVLARLQDSGKTAIAPYQSLPYVHPPHYAQIWASDRSDKIETVKREEKGSDLGSLPSSFYPLPAVNTNQAYLSYPAGYQSASYTNPGYQYTNAYSG